MLEARSSLNSENPSIRSTIPMYGVMSEDPECWMIFKTSASSESLKNSAGFRVHLVVFAHRMRQTSSQRLPPRWKSISVKTVVRISLLNTSPRDVQNPPVSPRLLM